RPDGRFRVRALGPADVTLFDVVGDPSGCRVIAAARPPKPELVRALCDNLRLAYRLPAAPESDARGTEVRCAGWRDVQGSKIAWETFLRGRHWQIEIDVRSVELDIVIGDEALPAP